jgi:Branched-chain amino acid transport protein (AzlD)
MTWELLSLALLAGAANWAFRVLPTMARTDRLAPGGWAERFLAATGPAAIATLFVAALLPMVVADLRGVAPVLVGVAAVLATYLARRSVVLATLAGALAHGLVVWALTLPPA